MPSEANIQLAIFASGGGSNAAQICAYFADHPTISVALIVTNNPWAGVIGIAENYDIPCLIITPSELGPDSVLMEELDVFEITHIVLAGFLLLLPEWLIEKYPQRIINIHPALLPKYGGKGMYGHHVHAAVKAAGDLVSGLTIHEVNAEYDKGKILFQHLVALSEDDTATSIAAKVLQMEHKHYAPVIEQWVQGDFVSKG